MIRWLRERTADVVLAVAALAAGVAMLIAAERLPAVATFRDVGPAFFPEIIGWGFVVSGVLLLAVAHPRGAAPAGDAAAVVGGAKPGTDAPAEADEAVGARAPLTADGPQPRLDRPWLRFGTTIAVTSTYAFLLPEFGFLWTTVPFLFMLGLVFGSRRILANAATAVLATALLYLVFRVWLRVPLPM